MQTPPVVRFPPADLGQDECWIYAVFILHRNVNK
jgi:hypothetical protein